MEQKTMKCDCCKENFTDDFGHYFCEGCGSLICEKCYTAARVVFDEEITGNAVSCKFCKIDK